MCIRMALKPSRRLARQNMAKDREKPTIEEHLKLSATVHGADGDGADRYGADGKGNGAAGRAGRG